MSNANARYLANRLAPMASRLLNSSRSSKRVMAVVADSFGCLFAAWIAFSVRLGVLDVFERPFALFALAVTPVVIVIFAAMRLYASLFRFHGQHGLAQIARSCLWIGGLLIVAIGLNSVPGIPRTVSVIFPVILFVVVALTRIVAQFVLVGMLERSSGSLNALIYGAGSAGRSLAVSLRHERGIHLIAFADDDPQLRGQSIEGTPILSGDKLDKALSAGEIDLVLLAMPSLSRSARAAIVDRLRAFDVHVQTLPGLREIVDGHVSISDLREIEVTDLLARDPVIPDPALMSIALEGLTVLVTGAGGSIGSELCRQIVACRPARLILFEMTETALFAIDNELKALSRELDFRGEIVAELGNLSNRGTVDRLFARWRPHTVFHAAAYKHVPLVEANPVAGVGNNVLGTFNCAMAATTAGTQRFILVSTDKAVRPTNVMGASKRVCELILQALAREHTAPVFSMVRFGNVLDSSGSVVPLFRRQIASGGPITITHRDVTRFFMTIPEAAELVIQAGAMASGGEVYLLDMGEPVRIFDLATLMIEMSGRSVRNDSNPQGDIEIAEVGLRAGEKLYEELLIGAEAQPTQHPRIFRALEGSLGWNELEPHLGALLKAVERADDAQIVKSMAGIVVGYSPSQSPFSPAGAEYDETRLGDPVASDLL